jgi:hypothetical protein
MRCKYGCINDDLLLAYSYNQGQHMGLTYRKHVVDQKLLLNLSGHVQTILS